MGSLDPALEHHLAGRLEQAEAIYRQILTEQPDRPDVLYLLGLAAQQAGRFDLATEHYRKSLALAPGNVATHYNLACALSSRGLLEEAIEAYEQTIRLCPDYVAAHYNLANALRDRRRPDQAIASYRRAIALNPALPEVHENLGNVLKDAGMLDEAIACYREAIRFRPDRSAIYSNLLYTLQYHLRTDAATLVAEQQRWAEQHARPLLSQIRPHANDRSPDRALRIGYVSPNLRGHIIGLLLETFMVHHDRRQFFIACYSDTSSRDGVTDNLMAHSDLWRDTRQLTDEQLAEQIRQDGIDILVDLNAHMGDNRMLAFARKPAPVQVTYIGYPGSTGLETVDYRLTDSYLSPLGVGHDFGCGGPVARNSVPYASGPEGPEKLVYLPHGYWPYKAHKQCPEVNDLPAAKNGHVTFGCFNSFAKVNADVIAVWSRLMTMVAESRLHLLITGAERNTHVYEAFERHGIGRSRITLLNPQPQLEFLRLHQNVDIALDPFPYNGHTSSHDAIYMGVPVVTLAGDRAVGRAGVSLLSNLGLTELIAESAEQYVQIASALAADLPRLAGLRSTLRQRMKQSPLMDAPGFARKVEAAYREMWRTWCDRG